MKWTCSTPGCVNARIDRHNSKCRECMNDYMRAWRQAKRLGVRLSHYHPQPKEHKEGGVKK